MEFSKLYCKKDNEKTNEMQVDNLQLLTHLSLNDESMCSNSTHGQSLSMFCKLPLIERVKNFLQNGKYFVIIAKAQSRIKNTFWFLQ